MNKNLDELAAAVVEGLRNRGLSLSLAESCTGGMIAGTITNIPGASDIFYGSAVTYINDAKENILGVTHETLEKHGAVSEECAREMAEGSRHIPSRCCNERNRNSRPWRWVRVETCRDSMVRL